MSRTKKQHKVATDRIQGLVGKIKDKKIRNVVEEVIAVEISYRSSSRRNFPMQQLRDIVEAHVKNV